MTSESIILLHGSSNSVLPDWLRGFGNGADTVTCTSAPLSVEAVQQGGFTFLISYGYRYIIKPDVLALFGDKAINLHISLLPWNRGADPNFWSFVENTPKGVTIHHLDAGIDTGDVIVQKEVVFDGHTNTLATTYATLHEHIQRLFIAHWPSIRSGTSPRFEQSRISTTPTLHRSRDKEPLLHLLTDGWNTNVSILEEWGRTSP